MVAVDVFLVCDSLNWITYYGNSFIYGAGIFVINDVVKS